MHLDVEAHVPVWRTLEGAVLDVVMDVHYRELQGRLAGPFQVWLLFTVATLASLCLTTSLWTLYYSANIACLLPCQAK